MKRILCFGDSNTWGHNPADGSKLKGCWPDVLEELLPECDIVRDGVCGRSTEFDVPDIPNANGMEVFRKKYLNGRNEFDMIIIMLGTNDLLKYFNCGAAETARALKGFVTEFKSFFSDADTEILLVSPVHIRRSVLKHPIFKELYGENAVRESERFAQYISQTAKETGAYFLDAAEYASASDMDGVHMDAEDHEKLAKAVASEIKLILFRE